MGRKHFTEEQIAFALRQHDSGTNGSVGRWGCASIKAVSFEYASK